MAAPLAMAGEHKTTATTARAVSVLELAGVLLLLAALVLGGRATLGAFNLVPLKLCAAGVLAWLAWTDNTPWPRRTMAAAGVMALAAVLHLLQLAPLPVSLLDGAPARAAIEADLRLAGVNRAWAAISLQPWSTWASLAGLLTPAAVYFVTARSGLPARRLGSIVVLSFVLTSVVLGLAQLAGGPGSSLRFYAITNTQTTVGFFANSNHFASLMAVGLLLVIAWTIELLDDARRQLLVLLGLAALAAAIVLSVGAAASRAGFLLAAAAVVGGVVIVLADRSTLQRDTRGRALLVVTGTAVLGLIAVVWLALPRVIAKLDQGVSDQWRAVASKTAAEGAKQFAPFGSGLGGFVPLYQTLEEPAALQPSYINHVHNDLIEVWLEAGWPGLLVLIALVAWLAWASWLAWSRRDLRADKIDVVLGRAAALGAALLLLHSLADYPLRTTALLSLFAWLCALLTPTPQHWTLRQPPSARPPGG